LFHGKVWLPVLKKRESPRHRIEGGERKRMQQRVRFKKARGGEKRADNKHAVSIITTLQIL